MAVIDETVARATSLLFVFGEAERTRSFNYPGQVYANQTVEVAFEVTGKLDQLPVSKGQQVDAGDLLAAYEFFSRLQREYYPEVKNLPEMMMVVDARQVVNLRA